SDPLFQRLTNGEPFSRVDVKITEVFTSPAGIEHEVIFLGRLGKCAKNEKGEQELARLEMKSWKSLLTEVQLGISATPYCAWTYGDKNCKETPTDDDGTVDSIDGTEVVISGLPGRPDRFYHKGSVRKGGVWIDIRKWVSGTTFLLSRRPPSDWDSADVVVRSGCDGKLKTCRDVHDNESEFGGSGKKMPNYHPSIST
ncbi:MAG: phage BR0599 family protein, partial [Planctomycetota bacterium JB042]